jgi:hypothetical protein
MGARGNARQDPYHRKPNLRARWGPGQAERFQRDQECVELRRAGHTWNEIVERLGYASSSHAIDRYRLFLERLPPREGIEEQRELEMTRLDQLMVALQPKIENHDVRAVEVMIKLMERRARMAGYDTPVKSQVTVVTDDVIAEIINQQRQALEVKRAQAIQAGINLSENVIEGEVVEQEK